MGRLASSRFAYAIKSVATNGAQAGKLKGDDTMKINDYIAPILKSRYLQQGETPDGMVSRVASYIASGERQRDIWTARFFSMIVRGDFMPSSPTLMNAGTDYPMMSACFVLDVPDDMSGIFQAIKDMALIQQHGGGTGFNFSKIREKGAIVRSTKGVASGVLSFLEVFNSATNIVKQGGKRRGANIAILDVDHPEIEDFINSKLDDGRLSNFNISVRITDNFMNAVINGDMWGLRSRVDGRVIREIRADRIMEEILENAVRNGEPGVLFVDTIERNNPTPQFGPLTGVNPCLSGDTILIDGDRLRRIDEGDGKTYKAWSNGTKQTIMLSLSDGRHIVTTIDHKIKTTLGWREANDCMNEHIVEYDSPFCQPITTNQDMVLEGFLAGDGFVCGNGYGLSVKLNRVKEPEIALMLKNNGFSIERSGSFYAKLSNFPTYQRVGVFDKHIPDTILFGDASNLASYLRGLFEANGTVIGETRVAFKTVSRGLCADIQNALSLFGIRSYVTTNKKRLVEFSNGMYECSESYDLNIGFIPSIEKFRRIIGFVSSNKKKRLDAITRNAGNEKFPTVISIKDAGEREVWDFSMNNDIHENSANGIIVHNCGEVSLYDKEACNLGSINLENFVNVFRERDVLDRFLSTIEYSVRFLDDTIDLNRFPVDGIKETVQRTRKIGLGVTGLHTWLLLNGLRYDSEEGRSAAKKLLGIITKTGRTYSKIIALEKGGLAFEPSWNSPELGGDHSLVRNAAISCIAPTGTISMILDTSSSGIEPVFGYTYERRIGEETYHVETPVLRKLLAMYNVEPTDGLIRQIENEGGTLSQIPSLPKELRELAQTANEISPEAHIAMLAALQEVIDNNISKTIAMPSYFNSSNLWELMQTAWKSGVRGFTVYRDGSRANQVIQGTEMCPVCGEPIIKEEGCKRCPNCGWSTCSL